jgi:predicted dinucleotide-binding enzyme
MYFKKRAALRLRKASRKIVEAQRRGEAVVVLTGALTEAIWREGGTNEDAVATAEIAYYAVVRDLNAWFAGTNKADRKIVPFRRKSKYLRKVAK